LQLLRLEIPNGVLTIKEPLHAVWAHPTLLQQCLSNLLDNALKFVVPGTTPSVTVWSEKFTPSQPEKPETGSRHAFHSALLPLEQSTSTVNAREPAGSESAARRIRIYVEDNGIGIEPECRQKVFGVFERLHVAGKYEGTGIGLAIVARAIQRMNGSCGVEAASSGNGSRFWLELACAE
jgi:signal transduction histidine kinase